MSLRDGSRGVTCSASSSALPSALLFDCDGVLVDTEKDGHRVSFNDTFTEVCMFSCFFVFGLMVDWCGMGWEFEKFIEFFKWVFLFCWILVDGFFGF